jgi:hypothetical protein
MILNTIPVTPQIVESLTNAFGAFPLRLTDQDIERLPSKQFILRGTSLAAYGYVGQYRTNWPKSPLVEIVETLHKHPLTISLEGGNLVLEETASEFIKGNARSTGILEVDSVREVHYRSGGTVIQNPPLPESVKTLTVSSEASTGDHDVNRNRKVGGAIPGTSIVFNREGK